MKPASFEYEKPTDAGTCLSALGSEAEFAKALAGGQSLGPMMNLRLAQPDRLIDISGLDTLRQVSLRDDSLFVGALTTHAAIEDGHIPDVSGGMLRYVASGIGYRAIRNKGTIGGSVVHADPAGDWPSALLGLGADVRVLGPDGERSVALSDFQIGAFTVALAPEELVLGVEVPMLTESARWGYYKVCPKPGDFADSIGVFVNDPGRGFCRAVLGATETNPMMLSISESDLRDWPATPLSLARCKAMIEDLEAGFDADTAGLHAVSLQRAAAMAGTRP